MPKQSDFLVPEAYRGKSPKKGKWIAILLAIIVAGLAVGMILGNFWN